ncbi:hypothetical protein GOY42_27270, partial [Klebsiella pneumoniae]|nr:hypothetical protein [Klebsiella pneumoniae]
RLYFLIDTGPEFLSCLPDSAPERYKPFCSDNGHSHGLYSEYVQPDEGVNLFQRVLLPLF